LSGINDILLLSHHKYASDYWLITVDINGDLLYSYVITWPYPRTVIVSKLDRDHPLYITTIDLKSKKGVS